MATVSDYERIAKLTAYFVAVVYVTGVAVVNLRLAQFGISGMGLLREQYIFAGTWAILPVLAISVVVGTFCGLFIPMYRLERVVKTRSMTKTWAAIERWESSTEERSSSKGATGPMAAWMWMWSQFRRAVERIAPVMTATGRAAWATSFLTTLAGVVFGYAVNRAVPGATAAITMPDMFFTGGKILLFSIGIGSCGALAVFMLRGPKDNWNYILAAALFLTTAIVVLAYLSFFAVSVYARIPAVIGGGAETRVRVVLNLDPVKAMNLGIPDDGGMTLRLLFVASNMYYVVSPKDSTRALGIPSAAILGIETLH